MSYRQNGGESMKLFMTINMRPRERVFDFHIMNNYFLINFCTIFFFKIWVNGKHHFSTALAISTKADFKWPFTVTPRSRWQIFSSAMVIFLKFLVPAVFGTTITVSQLFYFSSACLIATKLPTDLQGILALAFYCDSIFVCPKNWFNLVQSQQRSP